MASGCIEEGTVVAFLAGALATIDRASIESHLEVCSACADLMTWAAADDASQDRSAGREGQPFIGQLAPGSRVDRYQILGAVGRGGMGEVYAAYHPDLDRRIALKVVHESSADPEVRRTRLLREARAIARLSHPNVVAVHDAGTVGDGVYIAMEFVEGETVDAWLRSKPRGWREILDVFVAAGRGLAAAHAAGIIHRDFKPQNVMIGRDGSVRVMDFGLARLAEEPADAPDFEGTSAPPPAGPATVTKTGARVGTLAYMSPEQFRGEQLDPRADQFSFCVALYEAIYGSRPALAHAVGAPVEQVSKPPRPGTAPAWLRAVVTRGLAAPRDQRFASMGDLIGALTRGQTRPRRRAIGAGIALAVVLVAFGGWRAASGARIRCNAPADRLAPVWSGRPDARRESIRQAFATSRLPSAETSWRRAAKVLDDYVSAWSAMYVQTCEATHVRGEQSGEVLDLRMSCLNDDLDQTRALTDALATANSSGVANAMTALHNLPSIGRCGDVAALRSAIPLPKNEQTVRAVRRLASAINDVNALYDIGNYAAAFAKAVSLRSEVEAVGYKPLLAQLLEATGGIESDLDPTHAETLLEEAVFTAAASRDDLTAARAASSLIFLIGDRLGRSQAEADRWARLAMASLDRMGTDQTRTRSWVIHNQALVRYRRGDLQGARTLLERSLALKESVLGKDHPDVARTLTALTGVTNDLGDHEAALRLADRSLEILAKLDPDSVLLASLTNNRGEVLTALGRYAEASRDFETSLRIWRFHFEPTNQVFAFALHGLGEVKRGEGDVPAAIAFLERALRIRERSEPNLVLVAETRFALAQCLWESAAERRRAEALASSAADSYARYGRGAERKRVLAWMAARRRVGR